jgi:hypothetical protein
MGILKKEVCTWQGRTALMQREVTGLHPSWQFRHTFNLQKVTFEGGHGKKMLIDDVRSRNVYENKQNMDNMSGESTDIFVRMTSVLQRITACDGNLTLKSGKRPLYSRF